MLDVDFRTECRSLARRLLFAASHANDRFFILHGLRAPGHAAQGAIHETAAIVTTSHGCSVLAVLAVAGVAGLSGQKRLELETTGAVT